MVDPGSASSQVKPTRVRFTIRHGSHTVYAIAQRGADSQSLRDDLERAHDSAGWIFLPTVAPVRASAVWGPSVASWDVEEID